MKRSERPRNIVVATDLSARCDRALDRAAQLAQHWQASLTAVHAVEAGALRLLASRDGAGRKSPATPMEVAVARLRAELSAQGVQAEARVVEGDPAHALLDEARQLDAQLVVTGLARDQAFGQMLLGTTVERLARMLEVPLLTVRSRVRGPYRRVLVATDLSPASLPALRVALQWFGASHTTVFHAYTPAFSLGLGASAEKSAAEAAQACQQFLAGAGLDEATAARLTTVLEEGDVEDLLDAHVKQQGVDLVVLGTEGAGGLKKALLGSKAEALLRGLACDVMVVRATSA